MRILVLPKNLEIGGSQVTAVSVAIALRGMDHEIELASEEGPLGDRVRAAGIEIHAIPSPVARIRRLRAIQQLLRSRDPDIAHAYEARGILETSLAGQLAGGVPMLGSILSTRVPWFLPENIPLTVGMPDLAQFTELWRGSRAELIEPAISAPAPSAREVPGLEALRDRDHLMVLVSRLVEPFKREGILRCIAAAHELAPQGYGMLIVGDGPARELYARAAAATNAAFDTTVVGFAGAMEDPSPAFAAADVMVGSGMSIIQAAMANIPSIVVGREGFSAVVNLASLPNLIARGFYGVGDGLPSGDSLADKILAAQGLASFELEAVATQLYGRYEIGFAAKKYETALFRAAKEQPPGPGRLIRSLMRLLHYRHHRRLLRRQAARDGLLGENLDNFVHGRLRNMALPPAHWGTGRNV